jgi:MbtH protein
VPTLDCSAGKVAQQSRIWQNPQEKTVMADEQEDKTIYKVVLNHEEQYSIWPAHRENALGWKDAGKSGTKAECLAYIKEVWTDMRPLSLRKKMQEQGLS